MSHGNREIRGFGIHRDGVQAALRECVLKSVQVEAATKSLNQILSPGAPRLPVSWKGHWKDRRSIQGVAGSTRQLSIIIGSRGPPQGPNSWGDGHSSNGTVAARLCSLQAAVCMGKTTSNTHLKETWALYLCKLVTVTLACLLRGSPHNQPVS